MIQRTDEWLMARKGCVGGSSISQVMAKGQGKTRNTFMMRVISERLSPKPIETYKNTAMERGVELEAQAITAYEMSTETLVEKVGWIPHKDIPWFGCSPDGLVGIDGGIEVKCPLITTTTEYKIDRKIPREYFLQMQTCMAVTDRGWWDYVVYCPEYSDDKLWLDIVRVERNDKTITEIYDGVKKFNEEVDEIISQIFK